MSSEFNYPKILNLIWDSSKLTFLNYLTILSFKKFHKDWQINVFYTSQKSLQNWKTQEQKEIIIDSVKDYWQHIQTIENVNMVCVDEFAKTLNLQHLGTVQQSDILRIYIMYNYGGIYSDFDIIYTSSIESYFKGVTTSLLFYGVEPNGYIYFPVGFFISKPQEESYKNILKIQLSESQNQSAIEDYQYFGAALFKRVKITHSSIFEQFQLMTSSCYLPITWFEIEKKLYGNMFDLESSNFFGVHWFNGSSYSRKYINNFSPENFKLRCTMDKLIEPYLCELFPEYTPKPLIKQNVKKEPKISIAMSYINRKSQLEYTLNTISKSSHKNVEIVIVDDGSLEDHRIEDLVEKFDMDIVLIRIDPSEKEWINPCVPYNIALDRCTGDIIILQNPEVCHVGDVLNYAKVNVNDNVYLTFSVVSSASEQENQKIYDFKDDINSANFTNVFKMHSWYNHPIYRNSQFHFLTAMTRNTLEKIGGFNETFKYGLSYDDDELVSRLRKTVRCVTLPPEVGFGIHLWHPGGSSFYDKDVDLLKTLININLKLHKNLEKSSQVTVQRTSHTKYKTIYNKNVILLGSTGMLGRYVKTYLQDKVNLVTIYRSLMDVEYVDSSGFIYSVLEPYLRHNSVIINCCGKIPQNSGEGEVRSYIQINTLFPKYLSEFVKEYNRKKNKNLRLIHITTDCVYSGTKGSYNENDSSDEKGIYGVTKSLGENDRDTIIRTSIIGEETKNRRSLIEWIKSQKDGEISGYSTHYWNGVTCLELSKIIYKIISQGLFWSGVRHIYSPNKVSKYDIVKIVNRVWDLNISIHNQIGEVVDKSLSTIYCSKLNPTKDIEEQLEQLRDYNVK